MCFYDIALSLPHSLCLTICLQVRESLEFSALLRLPASVTTAQRGAFIEEVLDILELRSIQHRKVGEAGAADGLSPGQRKVSSGVILFARSYSESGGLSPRQGKIR